MISDRIADDKRSQMKILNIPIPILMHSAVLSQIESFRGLFKSHKSQIIDVIQSDVALQNSKCIRKRLSQTVWEQHISGPCSVYDLMQNCP